MDVFYDKPEELLRDGKEIIPYSSFLETDPQYKVKFASLESLIGWRKKEKKNAKD